MDWRRRVAALFVELRARPANADTLAWFRTQKNGLYREHPQSPLPAALRSAFRGLPYWPFDPTARVEAQFMPYAPAAQQAYRGGEASFVRIGRLSFAYQGVATHVDAYWMQSYAGGLFVPFCDATNGHETYGGGRYVLDTIKSADLGSDATAGMVVLDFNYAYHPSCAFDPRWTCPLAPPENRLPFEVRAGEMLLG